MPAPTTAPEARLQGVATPAAGRVDSRTGCQRCGRPIPQPRPGQKACSPRCRWALWKALQRAQGERYAAREAETLAVLDGIERLARILRQRLETP